MNKKIIYTIIIMLLGVYGSLLYINNELNKYVNERYVVLTIFACFVTQLIASTAIFQELKDSNFKNKKFNLTTLLFVICSLFLFLNLLAYGSFVNIISNLNFLRIGQTFGVLYNLLIQDVFRDFAKILLLAVSMLSVFTLSLSISTLKQRIQPNIFSKLEYLFYFGLIVFLIFIKFYVFALLIVLLLITQIDKESLKQITKSPAIILLVIVLLLGFVLPPASLKSSAAEIRSDDFNAFQNINGLTNSNQVNIKNIFDTSNFTIGDWVSTINSSPNLEDFVGKEVNVIGFVFNPEVLSEEYFVVAKFVVRCCAVDAIPTGIVVESFNWQDNFKDDEWVNVKGKFELKEIDGEQKLVVISPLIEKTSQPDDPYIYI